MAKTSRFRGYFRFKTRPEIYDPFVMGFRDKGGNYVMSNTLIVAIVEAAAAIALAILAGGDDE